MASFRFYLLSAVICSVLVVGQAIPPLSPPEVIDVAQAKTTVPETTQKPETTTELEITTPSATTATPSPTTSTTTSTKTSTTPSTTNTTTTTTSSTTTSTTTQAPPSPTPKPVPGPPQMGTWSYPEKNDSCVMVQFAAQLNVTYGKANNGSAFVELVNVPANATVASGWCGEANQSLTLSWPATVDENNTLTILFVKNVTTKSYELKSLNVTLVPSMFPNISNVDAIDLYHGMVWQTPLATSYRCAAATKLTLTNAEQVNVAATLTLSQLQEEAFRSAAAAPGFSAARDCAGGDIPDAVPIAVGCALGGMVVVVLIAYLVARRRSAARGYLSM